jgi:hypothetical protein
VIPLAAQHASPLAQFVPSRVLLAQVENASSSIYLWGIVLVFGLVVLFAALAWARRRLSPHEDFHGEGFALSDLRQMHKEGKLSDDEFDRAKAKMVEAMHAAQARKEAAKAEAAKRGLM